MAFLLLFRYIARASVRILAACCAHCPRMCAEMEKTQVPQGTGVQHQYSNWTLLPSCLDSIIHAKSESSSAILCTGPCVHEVLARDMQEKPHRLVL